MPNIATCLEYVKYYERTYVGEKVRGRRMQPRFDPSEWSVFNRTLEDRPRTNNATEGGNAALNRLLPKADPVLSLFLIRIKREEERTRNLYDK